MDGGLVGSSLNLGSMLLNNDTKQNDETANRRCSVAGDVFDSMPLNSRVYERQTVNSHLGNANTVQGNLNFLERPESGRIVTSNTPVSLTGENKLNDTFTHNNMVPFFGSKVRQNVDVNASNTRLETFTGINHERRNKEEISSMFKLEKGDIHGTRPMTDELKDRYHASRYHQNTPLTQPINVGPGLNQGYTAAPSGGFQQENTLDFVKQPNVDELRIKTNPKLTYEGRVVSGFKGSRRGVDPSLAQNRVIRFHEYKEMPRMNTTVVTPAAKSEEVYIDRETNRQDTLYSYSAPAGPSVVRKPASNEEYRNRIVHRQNLQGYGVRNAGSSKRQPRLNIKYCTEKMPEDPTENNYLGHVKSALQQIVAPIQDVLRTTIKETSIHDARVSGNYGSAVKNTTMYDPNDIARTTIKETTIDDEHDGFMGGHVPKLTIHDPNDTTKPTIKETNIHDGRLGQIRQLANTGHSALPSAPKTTARETLKQYIEYSNLNGPKKVQSSRTPLKTTIKETIYEDNRVGIASKTLGSGYTTNPKTAPFTNKQFTSDYEYSGQAQGTQKGGYSVSDVNAPETTRQTTSDVYYSGVAEGTVKPVSYEDVYNATLNDLKENISEGREPTKTSVKVGSQASQIGYVEKKTNLQNVTVLSATPMQNTPIDPSNIQIDTNNCTSEQLDNRIQADNLAAFNDNPYTQSLNSTA